MPLFVNWISNTGFLTFSGFADILDANGNSLDAVSWNFENGYISSMRTFASNSNSMNLYTPFGEFNISLGTNLYQNVSYRSGDGSKDNPYNGSYILLACYMHYQNGNGTPFYVNTDCLDFSGLTRNKFYYDRKGNISINLFDVHNLTQTGLAIGKVGLKDEGNGWFSLKPDEYNFDMQKGRYARNFFTVVDWILHHPISPYSGRGYPLIFVNPIFMPEN